MQYVPQETLFKKRWRKKIPRKVNYTPTLTIREPTNWIRDEEIISLGHDELEALRLKNINGLGIISAAKQMNISKSLFAKIHKQATQKVSQALVFGKALHIDVGYNDNFTEPLL